MANKQKKIILIQARSDSSRLPGKVLKFFLGKPMIIHQLERVSRTCDIDEICLITSDEATDDKLVETVQKDGYKVFRGSKHNVLSRYYEAAKSFGLDDNDLIIRLTGDCPLSDPLLIHKTIQVFLDKNVDFLSNMSRPLFPDGFDVSIFNYRVLKQANNEAETDYDKEHVVPYIKNSGRFKIGILDVEKPNHIDKKLSVDTNEDFERVKEIFDFFGSNDFSFSDVTKYLDLNKI